MYLTIFYSHLIEKIISFLFLGHKIIKKFFNNCLQIFAQHYIYITKLIFFLYNSFLKYYTSFFL